MTAVIGPVRIQHADLRHRGIPVFLPFIIVLNMQKILEGHRQSKGIVELPQIALRHRGKPVKHRHICRLLVGHFQRLRFHHARLSRIHRIDTVSLDPRQFLFCDIFVDQISHSRSDNRFLVLF